MIMKTRFVKTVAIMAGLVMSVCAKAQDVQVATLQHGDAMSAYYGADAFKNAMEAAESGDLISLSAGSFNAASITKAVKIQGAGYVQDLGSQRYRTSINGDLNITLEESEAGLTIEGIWHDNNMNLNGNLQQFTIAKSRCNSIIFGSNSYSLNSLIKQCRIVGELNPSGTSQNLCLYNSVANKIGSNAENSTIHVKNSIITGVCGLPYNGGSYNIYGTFENSIISRPTPNVNCSVYNCITGPYDFNTSTRQNCTHFDNWPSEIFVNNTFDVDGGDFRLTDEAAAQYLGRDGTQIGIYGGDTPFTDVPSNPQIVSKQIATQSDANGKLSVKITVEAQK